MRQINNCFTNDKITDESIDIYKLNDPKIYIYIKEILIKVAKNYNDIYQK